MILCVASFVILMPVSVAISGPPPTYTIGHDQEALTCIVPKARPCLVKFLPPMFFISCIYSAVASSVNGTCLAHVACMVNDFNLILKKLVNFGCIYLTFQPWCCGIWSKLHLQLYAYTAQLRTYLCFYSHPSCAWQPDVPSNISPVPSSFLI